MGTFYHSPGGSYSFAIRKPTRILRIQPLSEHRGYLRLFYITLKLKDADGGLLDNLSSYFGLRTVELHDGFVYINGRKLYQRLVLDQGFYPEGNWTSPSDAALERDIRLSMSAGFNGARLHQKVFEEKFLYQADRLGYIVWAESPSWGLDCNDAGLPARNFLCEWREIVERDRNHPSIITWTPLNETWDVEDALAHRRLHRDAYMLTKDLDPTRPVNDASGYIHFVTDLWTVHDYEQDPPRLAQQLAGRYVRFPDYEKPEPGQPYLIDEFGGIRWDPTQGQGQPFFMGLWEFPCRCRRIFRTSPWSGRQRPCKS